MERSVIRELPVELAPPLPDFAALHPGYTPQGRLFSRWNSFSATLTERRMKHDRKGKGRHSMMLGHNRKKMLGAECMAEMLKGYGVTHVFHVPAVLRRSFVEMERRTDIKRLHVHGEKSAAYMADGYARASGKPGVCMAQVIGALNHAAGLRDAWLAHSPVVAMTGGREPRTKFRKVYQEVDDMPSFEPVTKLNATVDDVARFPDMVRQAFRVAVSGTPGPVHLQFRGNE